MDTAPDFDHMVQKAVERVLEVLDRPRRSDVDARNHNVAGVATAVHRALVTSEELLCLTRKPPCVAAGVDTMWSREKLDAFCLSMARAPIENRPGI